MTFDALKILLIPEKQSFITPESKKQRNLLQSGFFTGDSPTRRRFKSVC